MIECFFLLWGDGKLRGGWEVRNVLPAQTEKGFDKALPVKSRVVVDNMMGVSYDSLFSGCHFFFFLSLNQVHIGCLEDAVSPPTP